MRARSVVRFRQTDEPVGERLAAFAPFELLFADRVPELVNGLGCVPWDLADWQLEVL
jgi:hypothetical protein